MTSSNEINVGQTLLEIKEDVGMIKAHTERQTVDISSIMASLEKHKEDTNSEIGSLKRLVHMAIGGGVVTFTMFSGVITKIASAIAAVVTH